MSTGGFGPICKTDVQSMLAEISDRFGELAVLFEVIGTLVPTQGDVAKLASLGEYCAGEFVNITDAIREQIECGGIRHE